MNIRRAIPLCLAGLFLAASVAIAADADLSRQKPPAYAGSPQGRHAWRAATHLVDDNTGTVMRLRRLASGALQFDIDGDHLAVRKTLRANGDFELSVRADDDLLAVVRRGEHVRVSRRNRMVDLGTEALSESDLDQLQQMLAGSTAVRRFRAMKSMLAPTTRYTALGAAVDVIDMLIGVLKGEAPTSPRATTAPEGLTASAMAAMDGEPGGDGPSCYEIWEREVIAAWNDYEACVLSFAWYNPLREVCAFAWVIRAESAWFRLIGCSAIPLKVQACDVETEDILR